MRFSIRSALWLCVCLLIANTAYGQGTAGYIGTGTAGFYGTPRTADLALQADVVVLGKVVEIDKATVDAPPYRGAPKERMVTYKIATVKIEEPLIGGRGLTQYRVGFPADEQNGNYRPLPVGGPKLAPDQEACYLLIPHHHGDFYILASAPLLKKDEKTAKQIDEVKKIAKIVDEPVAALKAKDIEERFKAAQILLQRYQTNRSGRALSREPIPADENKLILELLAELPWLPKERKLRPVADPTLPSRSAIWHLVYAHESGYRGPTSYGPGTTASAAPGVDYNKTLDEATSKFLKENMDKIKIKRFVK